MKFLELNDYIKNITERENKLPNKKGEQLLNDYNSLIETLHEWVNPEEVVNLIAHISTQKIGTKKFKLANRLHTMTNGGQTDINTDFSFNKNDELLEYLNEQ